MYYEIEHIFFMWHTRWYILKIYLEENKINSKFVVYMNIFINITNRYLY